MTGLAYVGCRTSRDRNAKGDGIGVWRIGGDRRWTRVQLVGGLFNPSYLAFDRTGRFLYTVHGDGDEASAFGIDPQTGELSFLNKVKTGGWNPVHLMPDPRNHFMVVANHIVKNGVKSGISSLPIGDDGRLGEPIDVVAFEGAVGPHRVEQPFPKPHQVEFDRAGRFIVVPDKGCDKVRVFTLDANGSLHEVVAREALAREASGPRHVCFHPSNRYAYVLNELDSTVVSYRFEPANGSLSAFQNLLAIPESFTGNSRASEITIAADGRFVYASSRGSDTIAIFAVDDATGHLKPLGWVAALGKTPRFIGLTPDGSRMFIANEESHNIVGYRVDRDRGILSDPLVVAETGSPTCILFR
jgi:6-phosphogluconolactonase (cycloisomerase 2 family)